MGVKANVLGNKANEFLPVLSAPQWPSRDKYAAAANGCPSAKRLNEACFARAIGANNASDLAGVYINRQIVYSPKFPVINV